MHGVQAFGPVLKIAMFDKNGGVQALIQYPGEMKISFPFSEVCFSAKKSFVACFVVGSKVFLAKRPMMVLSFISYRIQQ